MPKWLKIAIEIAITWLKRTGQIDPNVNKKHNQMPVGSKPPKEFDRNQSKGRGLK